MKLKPYPEYKDSSVPWLGEIPKHWNVRRLKICCGRSMGDRQMVMSPFLVCHSNGGNSAEFS